MPPIRIRAALAVTVLGVTGLSLVACSGDSKFTERYQDAPVGTRNTAPADLLTYPDGYSNVAVKCDGPNRVYVIFKHDGAYGSVDVVKDDPRCTVKP